MAQPYVKALGAFGLAKEGTTNTAASPTRFYPIDAEGFTVDHTIIEQEGLTANPTTLRKVQAGGLIPKGNLSMLLDPQSCGELLMGAFGSVGLGTASGVGTHTFQRLGSSQLPTYTLWKDVKLGQYEFTGAQVAKLKIEGKKLEPWKVHVEYAPMGEGQTLGTQSTSYGTVQPFVFTQATLTVNGTASADLDSFSIDMDNFAKAEHVIGTSRFPSKLYSEKLAISGAYEAYYTGTAELANFLNGSQTSLNVAIVHSANTTGGVPYRLTFDLPSVYYKAFSIPMVDNINGPFKVGVSWVANHPIGSTYGIQAALVNSQTTAY